LTDHPTAPWTIAYQRNGTVYLTRPGKQRGVSATYNHADSKRFYIFSSSVPDLSPARSYKPSSIYGLLYHGGDFKAAARELRTLGYGSVASEAIATADGEVLSRDEIIEYLYEGPLGDAKLLHALLDGHVAYDPAIKGWCIFDSPHKRGHWTRDVYNYITPLLIQTLVAAYQSASLYWQSQQRTYDPQQDSEATRVYLNQVKTHVNTLATRIRQCRKPSYVESVVKLLQHLTGVEGDVWDSNPELLGVPNGVVNLRTGEMRPSQPRDYIRRVCATPYHADADCTAWDTAVMQILGGDEALYSYMQTLLGYALTGEQTEHIFPIFYGPQGRNGKDTIINTVYSVLGREIAKSVSPDVMLQSGARGSGSATPELYDLMGTRIAVVNETEEHARIKTAQIKALTGGTTISTRPLYGDYLQFKPTHTMLLITNHRPPVPAHEEAMWQRLHVIEFNQRFIDEPKAPNEHAVDKQLPQRLATEREGILAWLVRGAQGYYRSGTLTRPATVKASGNSFREEMDTVAEFVAAACTVHSVCNDKPVRIYKEYRKWCEENAFWPIGRTTFFEQLASKHECRLVSRSAGVREAVVMGIKFGGVEAF